MRRSLSVRRLLTAMTLALGVAATVTTAGPAERRPASNRAQPRTRPSATPPRARVTRSASGFTLLQRDGLDIEARDYLGTPKTEEAVRKALEYLKRTQQPDGSWGGSTYGADVGIVGLCAMAFLSAGHQPDRGPYGDVVRRAADYILRHCQRTGLIANTAASAGPVMYGHGFATLALAELYGMTRRPDVREKLENAVQLIIRTQNDEGGWRYLPRVADADISVVICQVMALRAAHNAGIRVPDETTARAVEYVKRCANNYDGGFSYMPTSRSSGQARTGAGVLCLIVMGHGESEECKRGIEYLMNNPPGNRDGHTFYMLYYCTQAMYQAGDKAWRFWFPKAAEFLLARQRSDGAWYDSPGPAYATAMGVLSLQVPAALLPIYQK